MRKKLTVLVAMTLMLALSAVPALTLGRHQGQLERGPAHANAIRSF